jgi:hypothetical protein
MGGHVVLGLMSGVGGMAWSASPGKQQNSHDTHSEWILRVVRGNYIKV